MHKNYEYQHKRNTIVPVLVVLYSSNRKKNGVQMKDRQRQGSNLRGQSPLDFKSNSLTTRTRCQVKPNKHIMFILCADIQMDQKIMRSRQDSNLQSLVPKTNALSIRPRDQITLNLELTSRPQSNNLSSKVVLVTDKIPPPGLEPGSFG